MSKEIFEEVLRQVEMNTDSIWIQNVDLSEIDLPDEVLGNKNWDSSGIKFDSCNLNKIPAAVFLRTGINSLNLINN